MKTGQLFWSEPIYETTKIVRGTHKLGELPTFSLDEIAGLFDIPGAKVDINVMGTDPEKYEEWGFADRGGFTGKEIIDVVKTGRVWSAVIRANDIDEEFGELARKFKEETDPDGSSIGNVKINVLVSSPGAQVYYHTDPEWNVLIQIHGKKRIYIYPSDVEALSPRAKMEAIYSGEEEEIRFQSEFDESATPVDLEPGDFVAWPLNGPHRVVNQSGLNVSLALSYESPRSRRRMDVSKANEYLRKTWNMNRVRSKERGLGKEIKLWSLKILKLIRKPKPSKLLGQQKVIEYVVDPAAPLGYTRFRNAHSD